MALAKTTAPTLTGTVPRARLFRRLDQARRRPVTWVWAPPGAGKTTLVASYLATRRLRGLWYQLDEGDADRRDLLLLPGSGRAPPPPCAAAPDCRVPCGPARVRAALLPRALRPAEAALHRRLRQLPGRAGRLRAPRRHGGDGRRDPGRRQVIFISRSEPPPAFARHRVHQHLEILDWSELRFTPTEVAGLTRKLAPGRWSRETIRSLYDTVDGWCAGLVLLLEQLRSEGRASRPRANRRRRSCSTTSRARSSRTPIPTSRTCCFRPRSCRG